MWSGAAQVLLITLVLIGQSKQYFIARSQQIAPHMDGVNSVREAAVTVLIVLESLFHPLSLFLLYLAFEGAVRFIGSLVTSEVVPSLLVFLWFKLSASTSQVISDNAGAPRWQMQWNGFQTVGYGLPQPR